MKNIQLVNPVNKKLYNTIKILSIIALAIPTTFGALTPIQAATNPYLIANKYNGLPSSELKISGYNFDPNQIVVLTNKDARGDVSIQTDNNGNFTNQAITIPYIYPTNEILTGSENNSNLKATLTYYIDGYYPMVSLNNYILPGQSTILSGSNFPANQTISLLNAADHSLIKNISTDNSGNLMSTQLTVPYIAKNTIINYALVDQFSDSYTVNVNFTLTVGSYYPQINPSSYYISHLNTLDITANNFAPNEMVHAFLNDNMLLAQKADSLGNINFNNISLNNYSGNVIVKVTGTQSGEVSIRNINTY